MAAHDGQSIAAIQAEELLTLISTASKFDGSFSEPLKLRLKKISPIQIVFINLIF